MISVNIDEKIDYCYRAPFHPPVIYEELLDWQREKLDKTNTVYSHVRKCMENMGLDKKI